MLFLEGSNQRPSLLWRLSETLARGALEVSLAIWIALGREDSLKTSERAS